MVKINHEEIVNYYLINNISISKMSKIDNFPSAPTITKILKKYNIPIRKHNYQLLDLPIDRINELYESGKSTLDISKIYNCSDETIRKYILHPRTQSEINLSRSSETIQKISQSCKSKWVNKEYKNKVLNGINTEEYKRNHSIKSKSNWTNKEYKEKQNSTRSTKEYKEDHKKKCKETWQNKQYREKQKCHFNWRSRKASEESIKTLSSGPKRDQWIEKLKISSSEQIANQPRISMQQKQLYYLLEQSNINFYEEGPNTRISPFYTVDCLCPDHNLIIEVQGEYWHSLDRVKLKDKQKKTYIERHTTYKLLYLDELDFKSFQTIKRKLSKYNIKLSTIQCNVKDLSIIKIDEKQARLFYETFHYTSTIRKGSTTFGAFYNGQLIGAISYNPPIRSEIAKNIGCPLSDILEISRLAISSNIECKNTASWFISKTIKSLPKIINIVIAYSDYTYGHTGTVYKASNFIMDKLVENNYHYENENGEKFHKRTIWGRSKQFKMSERFIRRLK